MKKAVWFVILTTFILTIPLVGISEVKEEPCTLKECGPSDDGVFKVEMGTSLKATAKFRISSSFKKKVINANIKLKNTSDKPMSCQYNVAFFDKDGTMLGCASQGKDGMDPGKSTQFGSCIIPLPQGYHEKVASYKIAFYESDKPVGKQ